MNDAEPSFSPYDNIMVGLDYAQRRYAPDEYARRQTFTPEQWAAELAERRRVREIKRAAERAEAEAAHVAALADSRGLRRAVLELHAPTFTAIGSNPGCSHCQDSEFGADDWPCETYVLARDFPGDAA